MHRSRNTLILATAVGSTLTMTGLAFGDGSAKPEAANQQKGSANTVVMRAEPTEVAIQASTDQVKELQRELAARGFYQGAIDGVPGAKTRAALRNFQVQQGIPIEGGLNAQTRDSLGLEWDRQPVKGTDEPRPEPARGTTLQEQADLRRTAEAQNAARTRSSTESKTHVQLAAMNLEQTKEMQQRLQQLGYYQGPVDGVFGAGTRTALTRYFQRQAQLASQGMVDGSAMEVFGIDADDVKRAPGTGTVRTGTATE